MTVTKSNQISVHSVFFLAKVSRYYVHEQGIEEKILTKETEQEAEEDENYTLREFIIGTVYRTRLKG